MTAATVDGANAPRTRMERMLDGIERVGNKVPHPAMLFVYLIVGVIVLSQILFIVVTAIIDLILTGAIGQWPFLRRSSFRCFSG
jgi:p-aminobenzoyl-glutamate transporter AbgT